MDESSSQISATVFTLAKSYGSLSNFLQNPENIFDILILKTVCRKKFSFSRVIAACHGLNLLIFLT